MGSTHEAARATEQQVASERQLRVSDALPRPYERHEPEKTALYKIVSQHLETFLAEAREHHDKGLPKYVEKELREYLDCGIVSRGYVLGVCPACGRSIFVALSCKRRTCPSCNARRMYNGAAHIVDHVIPDVPVRQYVLSVPYELRVLLAARADVFTALTNIFIHEVFRWQRERACEAGLACAGCGAVAAHHRAGASVNLNPHIHAAILDGVFERSEGQGPQRVGFHRLPAPRATDLVDIAFNIHQRFLRWLDRHHLLKTESDDDVCDDPTERSALEACAQGALGLGGLSTVRRRGGYQDQDAGQHEFESRSGSHRVGEYSGYSLFVGDPIPEGNLAARERLLRYCLRPPLSLERLSLRADGNVVYQVKATRHGKATERVMTPMQFLARFVSLIPPPRYPLWRYFGVLSAHCSVRASVVPGYPEAARGEEFQDEHDAAHDQHARQVCTAEASAPHSATDPMPLRPLADAVARGTLQPQASGAPNAKTNSAGTAVGAGGKAARDRPRFSAPWRIDWATLLRRVWDVDALACPCGGRLKLKRLVTDATTVRETLKKAGLAADPPPVARARSPTFFDAPPPDWD